ncbi:hypothetical protein D3C85_1769920 [compost metagenome]
MPSRFRLMPFRWGRSFFSRLVRSVEACIQKSCRVGPTSGKVATLSVGGGMCRLPSLTMARA